MITIVSVLFLPVLYVAVFCAKISYRARHQAWQRTRSAEIIDSCFTWLPTETKNFIYVYVWAKIDPAGWALLDSRY